jgi:hypothetical protein
MKGGNKRQNFLPYVELEVNTLLCTHTHFCVCYVISYICTEILTVGYIYKLESVLTISYINLVISLSILFYIYF